MTATIAQSAPANRPDPAPDPYTGLQIYIAPTVFDLAARKFKHRFEAAMAEFKRGDKSRIQRQVFRVFRDAAPNEVVQNDRAFMARITDKFRKPDGSVPEFAFRENGDILFVCVINEQGGRDGKPQISAISLAKLDPYNGRVVLESVPSKFPAKGGRP